MPTTFIQYFGYGLVVASVIALALVTRATIRKFGSKRNLELPRCAKCGRGLVDMASTTCPDCSTNVITTGVLRPGYRERPNLAMLAGWTALCAAVTTLVVLYCPIQLGGRETPLPTFYWAYPVMLVLWTLVSLRIVAKNKNAAVGQFSVHLVTPPVED